MNRHTWTRWHWIAWMAVFGLVAAPTLSHALAHARQDGAWASVCTSDGLRQVLADGSVSRPTAGAGERVTPGAADLHTLSHCPMCGLAGSGLAPLPAAPALLAPPPGLALAPADAVRSWLPTLPRHDAPARAPPSLP